MRPVRRAQLSTSALKTRRKSSAQGTREGNDNLGVAGSFSGGGALATGAVATAGTISLRQGRVRREAAVKADRVLARRWDEGRQLAQELHRGEHQLETAAGHRTLHLVEHAAVWEQ
jgi:hypothetical protein